MGRHRAYPRDPMKRSFHDIARSLYFERWFDAVPIRYVLGVGEGSLTPEEIDKLPKVYAHNYPSREDMTIHTRDANPFLNL